MKPEGSSVHTSRLFTWPRYPSKSDCVNFGNSILYINETLPWNLLPLYSLLILVTPPVTNIRQLIIIFESSAFSSLIPNGHKILPFLFITCYTTCHILCSPCSSPSLVSHTFLLYWKYSNNTLAVLPVSGLFSLSIFDIAPKVNQLKIKANITN